MASAAHKTEISRLREQFRRDLRRLRQKYENLEISRQSGIDPTNLSSYGSGKKAPGLKVLMQFYNAFANEIQNPLRRYDYSSSNEVEAVAVAEIEDPSATYHRKAPDLSIELIHSLKQENAHLREAFDKIVASNEKLAQSTLMMAEANKKLVERFTTKNVS